MRRLEIKCKQGRRDFSSLLEINSENFLHHVFIHTHFTKLSLSGFCAYTERSVDLGLRAMIDRVESFEVLTV